jgi:hypothetical protein
MPRGAILKYKKPELLEAVAMAYIKECNDNKTPVLYSGLLLALDISRDTLNEYEKREAYKAVVKKIKLHVEQEYERMLHSGKPVGGIFALKNFGWKDTETIEGNFNGTMTFKWVSPAKKTPQKPNK